MKTSFTKLSAVERKSFSEPLNTKLKDVFIQLSGKNKSILEGIIENAPLDFEKNTSLSLRAYFDKLLLQQAKKQNVDAKTIEEIQKQFDRAGKSTISDLLSLETPVKEHPVIGREFRKQTASEIGKIIGLETDKLEKFVNKDIRWDELNVGTIESLISSRVINKTQGKNLMLVSDLSRLTGDNIKFIQSLNEKKIESIDDLVTWTKDDWVNYIKDKNIELPEGESSAKSYADRIFSNLKSTFPTRFLWNKLNQIELNSKLKLLGSVGKLLGKNDVVIHEKELKTYELDWSGIKAQERKKIEGQLKELHEFSNAYKGLGIRELINNKDLNKNDKEKAITSRFDGFSKFIENNRQLDL